MTGVQTCALPIYMDASDTAYINLAVNNSTKTVDFEGGGNMVTRFAGFLVC